MEVSYMSPNETKISPELFSFSRSTCGVSQTLSCQYKLDGVGGFEAGNLADTLGGILTLARRNIDVESGWVRC
jgi:hypothetical protein